MNNETLNYQGKNRNFSMRFSCLKPLLEKGLAVQGHFLAWWTAQKQAQRQRNGFQPLARQCNLLLSAAVGPRPSTGSPARPHCRGHSEPFRAVVCPGLGAHARSPGSPTSQSLRLGRLVHKLHHQPQNVSSQPSLENLTLSRDRLNNWALTSHLNK